MQPPPSLYLPILGVSLLLPPWGRAVFFSQGLLLAGGFDCALRGWGLVAGEWAALFSVGAGVVHNHPLVAIGCGTGTDRAATLDASGKLAWWDQKGAPWGGG